MPDAVRLPPPDGSVHGGEVVNLANAITALRLCLVPMAVWLVLRGHSMAAFWLFVAAGMSDAVDGWLARRRGPSALGAVLDPLADKVLLISMYVTLVAVHVLPEWLAALVVVRDVVIMGGVLVLAVLGRPVEIRPLRISKLNTVLQIVLVGTALLQGGLALAASLLPVLIGLVTVSTLLSGAAYVRQAAQQR